MYSECVFNVYFTEMSVYFFGILKFPIESLFQTVCIKCVLLVDKIHTTKIKKRDNLGELSLSLT